MSQTHTTETTDENLVDACRAFAEVRNRANSEADDLVQDACVRALQADVPVRKPMHYLMRIARNLFIDRRRRARRESALFATPGNPEYAGSDTLDPERVLAGKQELRLVLVAIGALPPRCREAFVLHRFDGLSYAAVARRMGVSTSMVEKHIVEAMRRIASALRAGDSR
jgi:RNA polymerase sigma factor (sigma-70 family)